MGLHGLTWALVLWLAAPAAAPGGAGGSARPSTAARPGGGPKPASRPGRSRAPEPAVDPAQAAAARTRVEARLGGLERGLDEAELRELGPGADRALVAIASDEKAGLPLRVKAIGALAYTPTRPANEYLRRTVTALQTSRTPEETTLLRKAAVSLGNQSGPAAVDTLAPLLEHPDPAVRTDATIALALCRTGRAAEALQARFEREPDDGVRAQMARQLEVLRKSLPPAPAPPVGGPRRPPPRRDVMPPPASPNDPRPRIGGDRF